MLVFDFFGSIKYVVMYTKSVQINIFHTNNIASLRVSLQDALELDVMLVDLGDLFINQKQNVILAWVFGSYL